MSCSEQVGANDTKVEKQAKLEAKITRGDLQFAPGGRKNKEEMLPKSDKKSVIGTKNLTSHSKERHGKDGLVS